MLAAKGSKLFVVSMLHQIMKKNYTICTKPLLRKRYLHLCMRKKRVGGVFPG